jgi:hypothetical protein
MASSNFLPDRESELVAWSVNFKMRIAGAPMTVGLTAAQAATYGALHDSFVAAWNVANNDGGNSTANIVTKNAAKAALVANARLLAGIVQKFPGTTDTHRAELGLSVRHPEPAPVPPPAFAPAVLIRSTIGNTVRIRLVDTENPTRRGKPAGVDGATVFSFVGHAAPTDEGDWKFEGNTSRTTIDVHFPKKVPPGTKVWFTAFWFNQRKQPGPAATPVATNLQGGSTMAA